AAAVEKGRQENAVARPVRGGLGELGDPFAHGDEERFPREARACGTGGGEAAGIVAFAIPEVAAEEPREALDLVGAVAEAIEAAIGGGGRGEDENGEGEEGAHANLHGSADDAAGAF